MKAFRVQLRRDPFARQTLVRFRIPPAPRIPCAWCGCRSARFRYRWEPDSGTPRDLWLAKLPAFCCVGCWEAYGGGR